MKRIIYLVLFLVIIIFGIIFAVLNADSVPLNYYFGTKQIPLSLVLVFAMSVGAVLGVLASLGHVIRARREVARLRKAAELAEKEVANLRAIPIRDEH